MWRAILRQPVQSQNNIHAGCACGSISIQTQYPKSVIHCHCQLCRRLSGAVFTTWASIEKASMQLQGADELSSYAASDSTQRHFCRQCGNTSDVRMPEIVGLPAGIIQNGAKLQVSAHYFVDHGWHIITDDLPCFGGESGYEPY